MKSGGWRSSRLVVGGALLVLLLTACGEAPVPEELPERPARETPETRPGIRFDPAAIRPGDSVGVLVLDSIAADRNLVDSTRVGLARFRGRLELSGRLMPHPDDDLRGQTVCFEADPGSAARMPRWLHDERRPWFCFSNPDEAGPALDSGGEAAIVIDEFTIHRGLSDEVNSARFVEQVGT